MTNEEDVVNGQRVLHVLLALGYDTATVTTGLTMFGLRSGVNQRNGFM